MKVVLYCCQAYSFSIMSPLEKVAKERGYQVLWYLREDVYDKFPFKATSSFTGAHRDVDFFEPDIIFVPANDVPYYFRGVKVQIFHGFAGEKKGHFRIRDYFDLYLTQGPYFTRVFEEFSKQHKDFEVVETGWPKLDCLFDGSVDASFLYNKYHLDKNKETLLFAPTFSPKLTSANALLPKLAELTSDNAGAIGKILVKFHPLMDEETLNLYKTTFANHPVVTVVDEDNLIPLLIVADLMISDTSSAVYEFLLMNKPVVTLNTSTAEPAWVNCTTADEVIPAVSTLLESDKEFISEIGLEYHPYRDGKSAERMMNAAEDYIRRHGVPSKRNLPLRRQVRYWLMRANIFDKNR
jgi:CDP-ribitol ribitolphosphotransferase / teichoic acid ribitol-phosphate polymerase